MATIRRLWSTQYRLRFLAITLGVGLIYLLPFLTVPGLAAIYMKIDGIDGDAVEVNHSKWIEVDSIQWGTSRAIATVGAGGGDRETSAPAFSDVTITKRMDRASAPLFFDAVAGKSGKTATIHITQETEGQPVYYELTLSDILISSFSQSGPAGDRPSETISLNFTKIGVKYTPINSGKTGTSISYSYDLATGKAQ
ncbi:MAG: Hcp family type VI secretion system effector [Limisphaerales bacterium]